MGLSSGSASTREASLPAACSSAGSDFAESGIGIGPPGRIDSGESSGEDGVASCPEGSGACSKIRCALVPEMPKEETPARRGLPFASQGLCSVKSSTSPASQSTWEEGLSTCRVRGRRPSRIAIVILITPATPAAAAVWPMLDLIEPRSSGRSLSWP